ncbi:hypothetical protein ACI7RC_03915 [Brevibacillus sp. B_LB10_24]|uniref:hypothetical protein n=1 Tax=Brevibacillus sp. B_LB10_24 TaxID=3380645 RepID=UPI0038BBDE2E
MEILLQEILTEVKSVRTSQDKMGTEITELRKDVHVLKSEVAGLRTDVDILKTDVAGVKLDVGEIKTNVVDIKINVLARKVGHDQFRTEFIDFRKYAGNKLDMISMPSRHRN